MELHRLSLKSGEPALALPSLAGELRTRTASLHGQVETVLGLPDAIRTRTDYSDWLARFLGLYDPLERSLATFASWKGSGFELPVRSQSARIMGDLTALGTAPGKVPRAPPALLPNLPTFAHAVGAFYVLQGARLGGRLILRDLESRMGPEVTGATRFFGGQGAGGPSWQDVRVALDDFGHEYQLQREQVVAGAQGTFRAMLAWFVPFCAAAAAGS
jgi:heme oxygenase